MKINVGVDLDGVLYDFGNSVRLYLNSIGREYGFKDNGAEPHDWNFFEYWGMDREEFRQICNDGVDAGYIFSGEIRPGAHDAMQMIAETGSHVTIITDRSFGTTPEKSHEATRVWLSNHNIPYDDLVFSADKTCVKTDMFVEDKLENYDALVKAGTDAYLITRDWNTNTPQGINDDRKRLCNVLEFAYQVQHKANLAAL